jgi:hypothetical protein
MDRHRRLHFVELNRGPLRSSILYDLNDTTGVCLTRPVGTPTHRYRRDRGVVVGRLDRAGKERDLAARRAIQAKDCHSMVRCALKIGRPRLTLTYLNQQENHRSPVSTCILPVDWIIPPRFMDVDDRVDSIYPAQPRRVVIQFWAGTFFVTISGYSKLIRIPRRFA